MRTPALTHMHKCCDNKTSLLHSPLGIFDPLTDIGHHFTADVNYNERRSILPRLAQSAVAIWREARNVDCGKVRRRAMFVILPRKYRKRVRLTNVKTRCRPIGT